MKITIYKCDCCGKVLSNEKGEGKPHLSINFAEHSGWVSNQLVYIPHWRHTHELSGIKQFCNTQCLGKFLNKLKKEKRYIPLTYKSWHDTYKKHIINTPQISIKLREGEKV